MPSASWRRAICSVHPTGFEVLVRWGCEQRADDLATNAFATWLLDIARRRLRKDAHLFQKAEVDVADAWEALDECASLVPAASRVGLSSLAEDQTDEFERSELAASDTFGQSEGYPWEAVRTRFLANWAEQYEVPA